jgi:hypothetical protein
MSERKSTKSAGTGRGGARPGSGRKKGSPNKRTAALQKAVEESGITPLDFMLTIMRAELPDVEDQRLLLEAQAMRFEAAKAAAPYVHARLSAIDVKADISTHEASLDDLA